MPQLLEHHGQLAQAEALTAVVLGNVKAEPTLGRHLLPHRRELVRR
jgi:hypothetical protein